MSAHNRVISTPVTSPNRDGVMSLGLAPVTTKMRGRYVFLKHVVSTTIPAPCTAQPNPSTRDHRLSRNLQVTLDSMCLDDNKPYLLLSPSLCLPKGMTGKGNDQEVREP